MSLLHAAVFDFRRAHIVQHTHELYTCTQKKIGTFFTRSLAGPTAFPGLCSTEHCKTDRNTARGRARRTLPLADPRSSDSKVLLHFQPLSSSTSQERFALRTHSRILRQEHRSRHRAPSNGSRSQPNQNGHRRAVVQRSRSGHTPCRPQRRREAVPTVATVVGSQSVAIRSDRATLV